MHPSTQRILSVDGPAGPIDVALNEPAQGPRALALIAHPNPLQGGTRDNKVVTTLARAFFGLGCCAVRPNFRGVGASAGAHDPGRGETDDLVAVVEAMRARYGPLPLLLAGFSFGGFVQTRVFARVGADRLVLVAPAVGRAPDATVPDDTLLVHGDADDVVPMSDVLAWASPRNVPVVVIAGGEHFFHGRLPQLQRIVVQWWRGHAL